MTLESGTWLAAIGREELTFGEKISADEAASIHQLMQPINALGRSIQTVNVQSAWMDLQQLMETLTNYPRSEVRNEHVLSKVVSWLSASRTYLNQWEAYWKQNHPALAGAFKKAAAKEYDRQDGSYALAYKLRNYTDHVSVAGLSITLSLGQPAKVIGDREILIHSYDGWSKRVLQVLKSKSESIDLMPIFSEAMQGLMRIHETSANLLLLLAKDSIDPLRQWVDRAPNPTADGDPGLVSGSFDTGRLGPGQELQLTTSYILSHERLDRLQSALSHPYDPLMACRAAFASSH